MLNYIREDISTFIIHILKLLIRDLIIQFFVRNLQNIKRSK